MSDVYGAGIDQAKLFQTISLAVADTTKEVLEGEQANRIRELEEEVVRLRKAYRHEAEELGRCQQERYSAEAKLRAVADHLEKNTSYPLSRDAIEALLRESAL